MSVFGALQEPARIVCVTPVRNEAWVLERFLAAASLWADEIVVADQDSDDESREIVRRFPKARLVINDSGRFDESYRQRQLIAEARRIPGRRLIVALDADELLTANFATSEEWRRVVEAPEGSVVRFKWVNVLPGCRRGWAQPERMAFGFMDDGREHDAGVIHSTRVPAPEDAPTIVLDEVRVLHLQYLDWARARSKQRWYQMWEWLNVPEKRPVQLFRQYNAMLAMPAEQIVDLDLEWLDGYRRRGINMCEVAPRDSYHWDLDAVRWIDLYGARRFARLDVWDADWMAVARDAGLRPREGLRDPRSRFERLVHRWLRRTQGRALDWRVRWIQRLLIPLGW